MDEYLVSLCLDYVQLVDEMLHGDYADHERHALDSQRQVTHRQLREYVDRLGDAQPQNMYTYARNVLLAAQAGGYR